MSQLLADRLPHAPTGASLERHALHAESCVWVEKNCYVDLWIGVLHHLGLEPLALMPFTLGVDFEGDQWTFFKPPLSDLRQLYGIDVQELNVWRPLIDHVHDHLAGGKLICTETDAFWLPDTVGTDYRRQHTKTTVLIDALDRSRKTLGYFHNAGHHQLSGDDYDLFFGLAPLAKAHPMPFYAELVRVERIKHLAPQALAHTSLSLLRAHVQNRPAQNPVERFAQRLQEDQPTLLAGGLAHFHLWAFANLRQLGAAFELGAACLRWQSGVLGLHLTAAADAFDTIAIDAKTLMLRTARAVHTGRPLNAAATLDHMASAWHDGFASLNRTLDTTP